MLSYAILACLCICLLASAEDDEIFIDASRILHHKTPGAQLRKYLISPDIFKARDTYVVAQYTSLEYLEKHGVSTPLLQIKLTLLYDKRGVEPKQCSIFLHAPPHAHQLDLTSVRRVNESNVVLSWTYFGVNDVSRTTVVTAYNIADREECKETKLALDDVLNNPIIVPTTENKFIIFINDYKYCRPADSDQCWFSYDLKTNLRQAHQFNSTIDWDWSTLRAERLKNGFIKISGTSYTEANRYLIYLLNPDVTTGDMYFVREIQHRHRKLDIVSADMSVCWIDPELKSTVHCLQMDNHGAEIFRNKIHFKEPVTLIDVRTIKEGEIFLLTKNADCNGVNCWHMHATIVTKEFNNFKQELLPFMCSDDDQKKLTIFDAKYMKTYDRNYLYYGCKWQDVFNLNSFYF